MKPETIDILRHLARRAGDVGVMARAALALEGDRAEDAPARTAPTAPPSSPRSAPMTPAQRQERRRQRLSEERDGVTKSHAVSHEERDESHEKSRHENVTRDVTSSRAPSLSSASISSETLEKERESSSLVTREPVTGVTKSHVTSRVTNAAYRDVTEPPADIPITDEMRASCAMAGASEPTPEDVVACLAHARKKGLRRVDWAAELVSWQCKGKAFRARNGPSELPPDAPSRKPIPKLPPREANPR